MRQQLLAKQQELLKLQQERLELELAEAKARLENQTKQLQTQVCIWLTIVRWSTGDRPLIMYASRWS